jgi:hypothetical protein
VKANEGPPPTKQRKEGFHSSFQKGSNPSQNASTVFAVIHEKQVVHQNSTVKLRTTKEFSLDGTVVPVGTFIFGIVTISNERVLIKFDKLSVNNQLIPFSYDTYDSDGIEGIYVPGLILNEVGKEAAQQTTANANVRIPIVGSVAINTADKENNKNSAVLTQDYKVILKAN